MSSTRRSTLSHLAPRRLLLAAALAMACLCGAVGQASAATYPAHTVLNYCSNRAGLGKVYHGTYRGIGYLAWDSNYDRLLDHMALDSNGNGYVDMAIADTFPASDPASDQEPGSTLVGTWADPGGTGALR